MVAGEAGVAAADVLAAAVGVKDQDRLVADVA
jgi:hypothetical protein